jgi:hypothetical protein
MVPGFPGWHTLKSQLPTQSWLFPSGQQNLHSGKIAVLSPLGIPAVTGVLVEIPITAMVFRIFKRQSGAIPFIAFEWAEGWESSGELEVIRTLIKEILIPVDGFIGMGRTF